MNERDSETIAGLLEQMGYNESAEYADADVIVVNTCSVRENADNRFFGLLGHIKHVKLCRPDVIVAVCGCMMQQEKITERIREKYAWIDVIFGTHNIYEAPELVEKALRRREEAGREETGRVEAKRARQADEKPPAPAPVASILQKRASLAEGLPARRVFSFKASVNIMYGCNNFCTYCIVPYTRGREISRNADDILAEVREAAAAGAKEILLLGQNVNSYAGVQGDAADADKPVDFADLIDMVDKAPGVERIRFMTSHPKDLSDKLIDRFRSAEEGGARHLCPSIHLPVQAGSTRVLELMNRRYTKEDYIVLVEKLREARPDIVITTDFIVGFPGETEEDFEDTMDVIERARFDAAFTFLFSPREGTPAFGYEDNTPEDVKRKRFDRMVKRLNEITLEKNRAYVGSVQDVLVEGPSKNDASMLSGRTFGGKLVNFPAPGGDTVDADFPGADNAGVIVPVRITFVKTFSFTGELAP